MPISNFLNHLKEGNFVFHAGGWGVGEIIEVSFLSEQIRLEFDYVSGTKDLSFTNAFRTLIPLKKEHFLAKRFGNPDKFEAFAKEHPVDTVRLLLKDLGPKTAQEIKDELCELVIPEEEWLKWWQSTRGKIKKDTMIASPESTKGSFSLRDAEETHEDRLHKALEQKPSVDIFIQLIYDFLRDFPSAIKNEDFRIGLCKNIHDTLKEREVSDAQELQLLFFLEDLAKGHENLTSELIARFPSIENVTRNIDIISFKKRALQGVRKHREDWPQIFIDLLLNIDSLTIKDYLLTEMVDSGHEASVEKRMLSLLQRPSTFPNTVLWYFKKVMGKKANIPLADAKGKSRLLEALFILLSQVERDMTTHRDFVKKIHLFITNGRFANIRKIFQEASEADVQEFLLLASKCPIF